jgi:wobble nucleotide-excising tRNase
MIKKITKLKNLGIFRDYKWDGDLEEFCRYNLIYGWNGAGKTTLSRLFTALTAGELAKHPDLEYEVITSSSTWRQGTQCDEDIRVFNRDYVLANVEKVGGPNPIFILGADNKALVQQIATDENVLKNRSTKIRALETELEGLEKRKNSLFTNAARTIGQIASGESTRSYRRPNAESDFASLEGKDVLGEKQVGVLQATLSQLQKEELDALPVSTDLSSAISAMAAEASELLGRTVSSQTVERLVEHGDIARWVEQGLQLHEAHSSTACEFCGQALPESRLHQLSEHFNAADKALKRAVDALCTKTKDLVDDLDVLDLREASNLYEEMRLPYQEAADELASARDALRTDLERFASELAQKKAHTTEALSLSTTLDPANLVSAIRKVNAQLSAHNTKTKNFDSEKDAARLQLKHHFLSEIFDEATELGGEIEDKSKAVTTLREGDPDDPNLLSVAALKKRLDDARAKISTSHAACSEINAKLALFLGRNELSFEVSGDGYIIKRLEETAEDLSESERTAIAFVYFVVHLSDRDFDLKNGIVVIDDPISSLDSNSLFQAFAFLKESVKDAKQVFILTHNFEFMRQVKNWFFHIKKRAGQHQRSFYMVNNRVDDGKRSAFVAPLDKLLMEFHSEYHYLFSLLQKFRADGSLEAVYNFPNIGRKFLETFLAFKVPSRENLFQKMHSLSYDEAKKTAILRFVETHSHAERSDGVLDFDMSLTRGGQTAINDLLEMVEAVDKAHYDTLLSVSN